MVNLKHFLAKLELQPSIEENKKEKEGGKTEGKQENIIRTAVWKPNTFHTPRNIKEKDTNMEDKKVFQSKIENISLNGIKRLKSLKIIKILHIMDNELIKNITAQDLVEYKGIELPNSVAHMINKNIGMLGWIKNEMRFGQLIKMMEQAVVLKSYNNLNVLMKAAQSRGLSQKRINRLALFQEELNNQNGGIFPFEWMLKDCAESNINSDSEIAARRFCKIIEKLKQMKMAAPKKEVKEKYRWQFYIMFWKYMEIPNKTKQKTRKQNKLYLVI